MAKREKVEKEPETTPSSHRGNSYFTSAKEHLQFVSTGCTLIDCVLGGGFALGRIGNIVGDKSTSKTGMATECLINFCQKYPNGQAAYRDVEAAFDTPYAEAMGLDLSKIDFGKPLVTVEDWHRDLEAFVDQQIKADEPGLYVLDSLDALSDEAEMERDIGDASYGGNKAKKTSELFRRLTAKIETSKVLLIVVSQVLWLSNLGTLNKTINKVKRVYGIKVKAKCKKNKVGMPFRECEFPFIFGYGIDDTLANLEWMKSIGKDGGADPKEINDLTDDEYETLSHTLKDMVPSLWNSIEESFLPTRKKYRA